MSAYERIDGDLDSLVLWFVPAEPPRHNARGKAIDEGTPAHVRLCGPVGGARNMDPERLRAEARRLFEVAP